MRGLALLGLLVSAAATAALVAAALPRLEAAGLRRSNYRGREIVTGAGALAMAGLLAGTAVLALAGAGSAPEGKAGVALSEPAGPVIDRPAGTGAGDPPGARGTPLAGSPVDRAEHDAGWEGALPAAGAAADAAAGAAAGPAPVAPAVPSAGPPLALLAAVAIAALVGLVDDLLGDPVRGWRGHLGQAARGRFTGGQLKILLLGLASLALVPAIGLAGRLLGAAVMAGTANALNLLDRRPGRTLKAFLLAWLALAATLPAAAFDLLLLAGAALVLLPVDLGERAMLGDAGSNAFGAALGWALAAHLAPAAQGAAVAALLALHVLAEYRSLTEIIEAVPPLRWLDHLGRG